MFKKKRKKGEADKPSEPEADGKGGDALPDNLKPLPRPDKFEKLPASRMEAGTNRGEVMRSADDNKKKKKKGCGLAGSFSLLSLLLLGAVVVFVAWLIVPFKRAGYTHELGLAFELREPPTEKTLFIADHIECLIAPADAELAFVARSVELGGIYREDVYVRAHRVTCAPGTVFEKDLEVFAVEYSNAGRVLGELKGSVVEQEGVDEP